MKDKIKTIRKEIPIPLGEAIELLRANDGDVEKCIDIFKEQCIAQICLATDATDDMVRKQYAAEKYDYNRTLSSVRDALYDSAYKPINGVSTEGIRTVMYWISIVEQEGFATSLNYHSILKVEQQLALIPKLSSIAPLLQKARMANASIFEGYTDDMALEDFVRRHRLLDDDPHFEVANNSIPLTLVVMKEELMRHLRNLVV